MHSIIEEIAGVEVQAAQIRQDAIVAARETVAAAQAKAQGQQTSQAEFARSQLREATQKAELEGEDAARAILQERAQETKTACSKAESKKPDAVKYLVGRVVSGA